MSPEVIDSIRLNFDESSVHTLNIVIAIMMYGMALDINREDFVRIVKSPRGPAIGLAAQFILLPFFTFLLTLVLPVAPSLLLGMILVASCPGGNLSNIITYLAKGNSAMSVSMTGISSIASIVLTPLNLSIWGSLNPATEPILRQVSLDPVSVFKTVFLILGVPLALGMTTAKFMPWIAGKARKPFKIFSVVVFIAVVAIIFFGNWEQFLRVIGLIAVAVFIHNALAISLGYGAAKLVGLDARDRRAVAIEVGIQNSALGLALVFGFFDGLGGMAIITGWWGVWHIIAGLVMALVWNLYDARSDAQSRRRAKANGRGAAANG
ncbi:MAG: bile acid:sodium symporter family protein [Spirochaetia bacterium]